MTDRIALTNEERATLVRTVRIAGAVDQEHAEWIVMYPHLAMDVESIIAAHVAEARAEFGERLRGTVEKAVSAAQSGINLRPVIASDPTATAFMAGMEELAEWTTALANEYDPKEEA